MGASTEGTANRSFSAPSLLSHHHLPMARHITSSLDGHHSSLAPLTAPPHPLASSSMHRAPPSNSRSSTSFQPHSTTRRHALSARKPGWVDTQHDLNEYKPTTQELIEKRLRLMSKQQLMKIAGIDPPPPPPPSRPRVRGLAFTTITSDKENPPHPNIPVTSHPPPVRKRLLAPTSTPAPRADSKSADGGQHSGERVVVQPVITPAPHSSPARGGGGEGSYRAWLKEGAILSPVLERSLEVELEAEEEERREAEEAARQEVEEKDDDSIIDRLMRTHVSPINHLHPPTHSPSPPTPLTAMETDTAESRQQGGLEKVNSHETPLTAQPTHQRIHQTTSPSTGPFDQLLPSNLFGSPASGSPRPKTSRGEALPEGMQDRLFSLLRQVTRHLDDLTRRQADDETQRLDLSTQLQTALDRIEQLEEQVTSLASAHRTVEGQRSVQGEYERRLNGVTLDGGSVRRWGGSQLSASGVTVIEVVSPSTASAGQPAPVPSYPLPPPFISAQLHQHAITAVSSPSPPRASRSPYRRRASPKVESEEERQTQRRRAHRGDIDMVVEEDRKAEEEKENEEDTDGDEPPRPRSVAPRAALPLPRLSSSDVHAAEEQLPGRGALTSPPSSGRRSGGGPRPAAGWTVHMR